ncbi:hypothetical protein D3C81_960520 [compost metagenome]
MTHQAPAQDVVDQIAFLILWVFPKLFLLGIDQINRPGMLTQKVGIIAPLIDNDFNHPQRQRGVRARHNRDPFIGFGCSFVKSRIDHYQACPPILRLNIFFKVGLHGHRRVIAPAQDIAAIANGVAHIRIAQAKHRYHGGGDRRATQRACTLGGTAEVIKKGLGHIVFNRIHIAGAG